MNQIDVDAVLLGTVNASLPASIDVDTLVRILEGKSIRRPVHSGPRYLFTEVSGRVLAAFLDKHGIGIEDALAVARHYVKGRFPALLPVEGLAHVG